MTNNETLKNKQYVLYNNFTGAIMRTSSKRIRNRYIEQFVSPPDLSYEQFITIKLDEHPPSYIRDIGDIPGPEIIGPYVLTADQLFEVEDQLIAYAANITRLVNKFLPNLHLIKFTQDEFDVVMGLLDLYRPLIEIDLGKYDDVEFDNRPWEDTVLSKLKIIESHLDYKPEGAFPRGENLFDS